MNDRLRQGGNRGPRWLEVGRRLFSHLLLSSWYHHFVTPQERKLLNFFESDLYTGKHKSCAISTGEIIFILAALRELWGLALLRLQYISLSYTMTPQISISPDGLPGVTLCLSQAANSGGHNNWCDGPLKPQGNYLSPLLIFVCQLWSRHFNKAAGRETSSSWDCRLLIWHIEEN